MAALTVADLLKNLDLGAGSARPLSSLTDLADKPTPAEQFGTRLEDLAGQYQANTPVTAVLKGITQGAGMAAKSKGEQQRQARLDAIAAQTQHWQEMANYADQVKQIAVTQQAAQLEQQQKQGAIDTAVLNAINTGDVAGMNEVVNGSDAIKRVLSSTLPDGATYQGVRVLDGNVVAVGTDAKGNMVVGSQPKPLSSFLSPAALQAQQELRLKDAQIANTNAQADKNAAEAAAARSPEGNTKPPAGYRWAADGQTLEAIPGGPATKPSGTEAGQLAIVQQGAQAVKDIRGLMFNPDGSLDKKTLLEASGVNVPLVGKTPAFSAKARELRTAFYNMANAKLRLESGAAVPETEVQRTADAYLAGILDTPESANYKLQAPEQYFRDFSAAAGRGSGPASAGRAVDSLPQGAQQIGTSGGKPVYRTPDGRTFVGQ